MKRILITGAGGFLGTHISMLLGQQGYEIALIGRIHSHNSFLLAMPTVKVFSGVTLPDDSLEKLIKEFKPDALVHCAGTASVPFSVESPYLDFQYTVDVCASTLETLRLHAPGIQFILLSSASVYGNPTELPVKEDAPVAPISPYAFHKKMMETLVEEYTVLHNIKGSVLRIFSAYGEFQKKQVIYDMFNKLSTPGDKTLEFFGTGNESRDFIHGRDIAQAIACLISSESTGVFNGASGEQIYIKDLVENIHSICNSDRDYTFSGSVRQGDPINWQADIGKLKQIGFVPEISFEQGLEKFWEWLKVL
ncbi:MAG: NAD-dependent epimerase/dehydratase family protein [Fibrobacterales bacterium]